MTKTVKNAKTDAAKIAARGDDAVVAFKKIAEKDTLPAQAAGILVIVKKAGKLTIAELKKRMDGKIQTKQPIGVIWSFYRNRLTKGGYLTVTKTTRSDRMERS